MAVLRHMWFEKMGRAVRRPVAGAVSSEPNPVAVVVLLTATEDDPCPPLPQESPIQTPFGSQAEHTTWDLLDMDEFSLSFFPCSAVLERERSVSRDPQRTPSQACQ